jgi:predicted nuclease of predicted toxin-antitoxin system
VRFKIDENLPAEAAAVLQGAGFDAHTVDGEKLSGASDETVAGASRSEGRILITLDLDFANIRAYPPGEHAGIVVLRVKHQDKPAVLAHLRRLVTALLGREATGPPPAATRRGAAVIRIQRLARYRAHVSKRLSR